MIFPMIFMKGRQFFKTVLSAKSLIDYKHVLLELIYVSFVILLKDAVLTLIEIVKFTLGVDGLWFWYCV